MPATVIGNAQRRIRRRAGGAGRLDRRPTGAERGAAGVDHGDVAVQCPGEGAGDLGQAATGEGDGREPLADRLGPARLGPVVGEDDRQHGRDHVVERDVGVDDDDREPELVGGVQGRSRDVVDIAADPDHERRERGGVQPADQVGHAGQVVAQRVEGGQQHLAGMDVGLDVGHLHHVDSCDLAVEAAMTREDPGAVQHRETQQLSHVEHSHVRPLAA